MRFGYAEDMTDERATRYAEAIHSVVLADSPEQRRDLVDAVVAVADAEQAELRAEVERLRGQIETEHCGVCGNGMGLCRSCEAEMGSPQ